MIVIDEASGRVLGMIEAHISPSFAEAGESVPLLVAVEPQTALLTLSVRRIGRVSHVRPKLVERDFGAFVENSLNSPLIENYCNRGVSPFSPLPPIDKEETQS